MRCPHCKAWSRVIETRGTRRRRECANGHRFTTTEVWKTMRGLCTDCQHWDRTGPDAVKAEGRHAQARLARAMCTNNASSMHGRRTPPFDSCQHFTARPAEQREAQ